MVALALALVAVAPAAGAPSAERPASPTIPRPDPPAPGIPRANPPTGAAALTAPPPGTTTLVSAAQNDGFALGPSTSPSISENGRWVAFASRAETLVAGDTNLAQDVFVRDRRDGSTVRLPIFGTTAPQPGGAASEPVISADGAAVAFTYIPPPSFSGIFVPCSAPRVLLWHRETGQTEIASLDSEDALECGSTSPSISGDGRLVAFVARAPLPGSDDVLQVFVRDMIGRTTRMVSLTPDGDPGNGNSRDPAISRDGAVVAFESDAQDLAAGDAVEASDVFARVIAEDRTELVSSAPGGEPNGPSLAPAISANGAFVAFESDAQNLVQGATPGIRNIYVRDRTTGRTELASTDAGGAPAKAVSGQAAVSADGRFVAFASLAPNLVAFNTILAAAALPPQPAEVYAHDRVTGETIRISEARGGGPGGLVSIEPTIGGNGRFVAFASNSPNLVRGDGNLVSDIFLRDLPPVPTVAPDPVDFGARAIGAAGPPLAAIVTNGGWGPLSIRGVEKTGSAAADFSIVLNACEGRVMHRTESCPITITFAPAAAGARAASLELAHNGPRSPATATLLGSGSNATVEIKPPVGRPGIVAIVTGTGFPPNTELSLTWSRGLTPKMPLIRTDARGAFRAQVLVFHNDLIGPRDLVVAPIGGALFPPFGTKFLVVEPLSEPPRFEPGEPSANRPPTLVFRH